jgi:hypothetical protein
VPLPPPLLEDALVETAQQRLLVGEAGVEGADRRAGPLRQLRDRGLLEAALAQQALGGDQQPV